MTDEQVIQFLEDICQEADKDLTVANRLAGGLRYYFINVHTTKAVSVKEFINSTAMTEARRVYGIEVEREIQEAKEAARDEKIAALETNMGELLTLVKSLTESKEQPAKKSSKKATEATEDEAE